MIDYCDQKAEVEKNPQAKQWIKAASNGDVYAYEFLWRLWCFEHCFDDLIDQDVEINKELCVRELIKFVTCLSYNPFYQEHKDQIYGLLVQACTRWLDGDEWEQSEDETRRICASVVRCGDLDIWLHVAYLTGGWDYMRKLRFLRHYDVNLPEQELKGIKSKKEAE